MVHDSKRSLALSLATTGALVAAEAPCDILSAGGVTCVAAHSTTRSLFEAFDGSLYQVKRSSDDTTLDIKPVSTGGIADSAAQDTFCDGTTCYISIIYDQSSYGNDLTAAPPGGAASGTGPDGYDQLAVATDAPVYLDGNKVYGVYVSPGIGYRIDDTSGVAVDDEPELIYAVLDGTHYNGECCFDYGNAEKTNTDNGNGHMEAVYFGTETAWGTGAGSGPWIMADMENGLFSTNSLGENPDDPSQTDRFITAMVKGEPNFWELKGANAQSGALATYYSGVRPDVGVTGYNPMSKEGAIILGIGGDNSNSAEGTFYEGVMTYGFPYSATDALVQANIVAAKYTTSA